MPLCNPRNYENCNYAAKMDEEQETPQPEVSEFKGKPVLRIPLVDNPCPKHPGTGSRSVAGGLLLYDASASYFLEIRSR